MLQPLPEPLLQSLLIESYPSLVTLTDTTFGLAFPDSDPPFPTAVGSKSILPSFASLLPRARLFSWQKRQTLSDSKEEKRFRVARWGFFGLSVVVLVGYVQFIGLIPAVSAAIAKTRAELEESREVAEEDDDGDEEYDDGDEEEGEGPTEQEE